MIEDIASHRSQVVDHVSRLIPDRVATHKIRCHGDLHLGQILMVKEDIVIIDFEGEPKRSLDERRTKWPAARDVAGIIRSIDYAVTATLDRAAQGAAEERAQLAPKLDAWREQSAKAVLDAYAEYSSDYRLRSHNAESERLLEFFLLEKAVYEVGYELSNRPTWVHIPLAGLHRILASRGVLS
jgi:maltose alpha-D-glucosyltransferase/alpha-amylase